MGGQQFAAEAVHFDMKGFARVVAFDRANGLIEAEAGIEWPELIGWLEREQRGEKEPWAIREKQTGVDRVSLGGSLSANIHGRGLRFPPFVGDIESFVLVGADGEPRRCSRRENTDLFALAIGGYGLFGIVSRVTLRLTRRVKVQRIVEVIPVRDLIPWIDRRIGEGCVFGDCQYSTDLTSSAADHPGVLSCYQPVDPQTPVTADPVKLSESDWAELYTLARNDKKKAFERYSGFYRRTSGQVYWSDTHQLAGAFEGHRAAVKPAEGTEMITEVYVSRGAFVPLLSSVRKDFLEHGVDMTYGTIRFIEKDDESFLRWAAEPSVCIVCNLHVRRTAEGTRKATEDFRRVLDRTIEFRGRYYLTYHRWATREQVEACYPQFVEFLRLKRKHDPEERFQSEWYRHYRTMFADVL
jgi:FAD/FMN-containing dehydrogenase